MRLGSAWRFGDGETGRGGCFVWGSCRGGGGSGRLVNGGVGPCCAGGDGEEFVKGQDAGFAAFPACGKGLLVGLGWEWGVGEGGRADTFLPFMEDGRARVVGAGFFGVREFLAAALVHAFEGHCG